MRVLQVSSARVLGGGETHVIELSAGLRELGHSVLVAGRANGPLQPDFALPFLNSADFLSALKLRRILRAEAFDVVHAHVARDYPVVAAAAWGVPDLRLVCTRHLLFPVQPHLLYRRVDGWLAPTSQILQTLSALRPKRSQVIPNWVDVGKFAYRPKPLHQPIQVGLLGQISPHKGHDDAVDAMRFLGTSWRLLIAGKGEADYVDALRRRAQGLPVEFLGFVSLPEFFQIVDVLIVPSWEEPFGIVLLEAMAAGIPVIASNRGGPPDILSGGSGILIEPRNAAGLAAAIRALSEDPRRRESIVAAARQRVESVYDISRVIPRVAEFYVSLGAGAGR